MRNEARDADWFALTDNAIVVSESSLSKSF